MVVYYIILYVNCAKTTANLLRVQNVVSGVKNKGQIGRKKKRRNIIFFAGSSRARPPVAPSYYNRWIRMMFSRFNLIILLLHASFPRTHVIIFSRIIMVNCSFVLFFFFSYIFRLIKRDTNVV